MNFRAITPSHLNQYKSIFYKNKLLLFLLFVLIILSGQLYTFCSEIYTTAPTLKLFIFVWVGELTLILLPFWFLKGKWKSTIWIPIIGLNLFWLTNVIYFRTYGDIMPLSSILLTDNIGDVVLNSVRDSLQLRDLAYPIGIILLYIVWHISRKEIYQEKFSKRTRICATCITLIWALGSHIYRQYDFYVFKKPDLELIMKNATQTEIIKAAYLKSYALP